MGVSNRKFIITLTRHLSFGWLLVPYWAKEKSGEILEIEEIADGTTNTGDISTIENEIIRTAIAYSERNLMQVYSKEKNIADFLQKMTNKQFTEVIRPFIEKKQKEIVHLLRENNLPLYQRDFGQKNLFEHNRIFIFEKEVTAVFNFQVSAESFRYTIACICDDEQIQLLKKTSIILVAKPACIIIGKTLFTFRKIEANRLTPFFNKPYVEVPASFTRKYMESILLPAVEQFPVKVSGLIELTNIIMKPKAELLIEKSLDNRPALSLKFRYETDVYPPGKQIKYKYARLLEKDESYEIQSYSRDISWEQNCVGQLLESGLKRISDTLFILSENAEVHTMINWITANKHNLSENFIFLQNNTSSIYYIGDISLERDVVTTADWFDIKIMVKISNFTFPFIRFKHHIQKNIHEFVLPDGQIALLPVEWFTDYKELFSFGTEKNESIRLRKIHYKLLEEWWKDSSTRKENVEQLLRHFALQPTVNVPLEIKATLRHYQQDGFTWMVHLAENNFGGCLADDMGLGKTLQAIALLQKIYVSSEQRKNIKNTSDNIKLVNLDDTRQLSLFGNNTINENISANNVPYSPINALPASLIIMPTSLIHNWKREIMKFSKLTVFEYLGSNRLKTKNFGNIFRHYNLIITTYGIVRNDIEYLCQYPFQYIILDESQYIKNPDSMIYHTVMKLNGVNRLILTGTPIENSLKDLWAQFNFINPGMLGTIDEFRNNFIIPITKEGNTRMEERLKRLIQPFFLRRTKEEVAPELPPLTEEVLYCDMSSEQEEIYKKEKNILRNALMAYDEEHTLHKNTFIALQGMTRLRLLANHPQMVMPDYKGFSGKMEEVLHYYETLVTGGHKVLIFSSFVKHLRLLAESFDKEGWKYAMLTGQTLNREEEINRFSMNKEVNCFLISLKAGGVGLNLTEADYVFIIDPWWNPAAEMQAVSRAHRIGQNKQVIVYRFISSNTIEEKIIKLQESKSLLSDTFITNNNPLQSLSSHEIDELFT